MVDSVVHDDSRVHAIEEAMEDDEKLID